MGKYGGFGGRIILYFYRFKDIEVLGFNGIVVFMEVRV